MEGIRFALTLEDGISRPAAAAKIQLRGLQSELAKTYQEVRALKASQLEARGRGDKIGANLYGEQLSLAREKMGGLGDAARGLRSSLDAQAEASASAGAALGTYASVVTTALKVEVALGAAVVGASAALAYQALEVTQANRELTASFEALGGSSGAGRATLGLLNDLSERLPNSRDELAGWTRQLQSLGITDLSAIRSQLRTVASAQAIRPGEGGEAYLHLLTRINAAREAGGKIKLEGRGLRLLYSAGLNANDVAHRLGLTVTDLEARLKAGTISAASFGDAMRVSLLDKGQGPLRALGDNLGVLGTKAKEIVGHLFDGVDTKPLTDAFKIVIAIGEHGTPSGEALKRGVTGGVNGIIRAFAFLTTEATVMFLRLELGLLRLEYRFRPIIRQLERFGLLSKSVGPALDRLGGATGKEGDEVVNGNAAAQAGQVARPAADAASGLALAPAFGPVAPVVGALYALGSLASSAFANGMQADLATVQASGHALGSAAVAGTRVALDAHSPSRVAMQLGAQTGEGFREGLDGSQGGARDGGGSMARAGLDGLSSGGQGAAPASSGGGGVRIDRLVVNITAPEGGPTDATQLTVMGVSVALERLQLTTGR